MSRKMEVIVFGFKTSDDSEIYRKDFFEKTYPFVPIQCNEKTTLASIIDQALDQMGIVREGEMLNLIFGNAKNEHGYPAVNLTLDAVDDKGEIRWNVPGEKWDTITWHNLKESKEAGLIDGDLQHIYIVLSHPYGNGYIIEWSNFINQLVVALVAQMAVTTVVAGMKTIKKNYKRWRRRGAYPHNIFYRVTERRSWDSRDLSKRIGIKEDDAKNLLKLFGYQYDRSSQLYVKSEEKNSKLIYNKIKDIFEEV